MLNLTFERAIENNEQLSCLMVDIDHFKNINDTYGHASGDIVIKELAHILTKNCRLFDIIGRVGGEEFCILLLNIAVYPYTTLNLENIKQLADSALYMAKNSGRNKVCDYSACICSNVINYYAKI